MKKWRCTVCNYVHKGDAPPDECPVCGVGPDEFVAVTEEEKEVMSPEEKEKAKPAVHKFTYGLFVIGSKKGDRVNAQTANTAFQVTSEPIKIAVGINNNNLTGEYIKDSGVFSVNILGRDQIDTVKHFGFKSGRQVDKFKDVPHVTKKTGAPILQDCLGYVECTVEEEMNVGTHTIFVGQVVGGESFKDDEPLTYAYYRKNKKSKPERRSEKMAKYECTVCGYIYDPAEGDPESGIEPGTAFEALPEDWVCPVCGVGKEDFEEVK